MKLWTPDIDLQTIISELDIEYQKKLEELSKNLTRTCSFCNQAKSPMIELLNYQEVPSLPNGLILNICQTCIESTLTLIKSQSVP